MAAGPRQRPGPGATHHPMPSAGSSSRTRTMYSRQVSSFREKLNSRILRPEGGRGGGCVRAPGPPGVSGQQLPAPWTPWAGQRPQGMWCGGVGGMTSAPHPALKEGSDYPRSRWGGSGQSLRGGGGVPGSPQGEGGRQAGPQAAEPVAWWPDGCGPTSLQQNPQGPVPPPAGGRRRGSEVRGHGPRPAPAHRAQASPRPPPAGPAPRAGPPRRPRSLDLWFLMKNSLSRSLKVFSLT